MIKPVMRYFADKGLAEAFLLPERVVKELVENSFDANCTAVSVKLNSGARGNLTVMDNGEGISLSDSDLLFKDGYSSKLEDKAVKFLGYRGKSLYIISNYANIDIHSSTGGEGFCLTSYKGAVKREMEQLDKGTAVRVSELYYNNPSAPKLSERLSFVNSCIIDLALSRPNTAFKYVLDGKVVFDCPSEGLMERVRSIFGAKVAENLYYIEWNYAGLVLNGAVSKPNATKFGYNVRTVTLNGRCVDDSFIHCVANDVYKSFYLAGQQPYYVLNISLPDNTFDVFSDVYKNKVNFYDEEQIAHYLRECLSKPLRYAYNSYKDANIQRSRAKPVSVKTRHTVYQSTNVSEETQLLYGENTNNDDRGIARSGGGIDFGSILLALSNTKGANSAKSSMCLANAKIIGMVFGSYILAEYGDFLYFVDYRAARAQFYYTAYIQYTAERVDVSRLYEPFVLRATNRDVEYITARKSTLNSLGIGLSAADNYHLRLDYLPRMFIGVLDYERFLRELCLDAARGDQSNYSAESMGHLLIKHLNLRCDNLTQSEMRAFLKTYDAQRMQGSTSALKTLFIVQRQELKRLFARTRI